MNLFLVNTCQMSETIAGVDEAGRGPLCGPVVAAAVILNPQSPPIIGLDDSKKLTEKKRTYLAEIIKRSSLAYGIGTASVEEIDQLNILQASLLAMQRAVKKLCVRPDKVWVDGNHCPRLPGLSVEAIIKGDSKVDAIAAASILAKVTRDDAMLLIDKKWPQYGIAKHKGYPTKLHLQALKIYGPAPIYRRSFKPVQVLLKN